MPPRQFVKESHLVKTVPVVKIAVAGYVPKFLNYLALGFYLTSTVLSDLKGLDSDLTMFF